MQPEQERGYDAEIAPAATHRPEEILVLVRAGRNEAPVRQHYIDFQQVVYRQATRASQVAEAAAQGKSAELIFEHARRAGIPFDHAAEMVRELEPAMFR